MRQVKMRGHPSSTSLAGAQQPHAAPPSRTSTRRARRAPPCFKNEAHQQLKRCDQVLSQSQRGHAIQGGNLATPPECSVPGRDARRADPSPPCRDLGSSGPNTQTLERAANHWPRRPQLLRNHPAHSSLSAKAEMKIQPTGLHFLQAPFPCHFAGTLFPQPCQSKAYEVSFQSCHFHK